MSLHQDLLGQALHLAMLDPRRPKQANLRRAVSTAYYAIFHLLVEEGTAEIAGRNASRAEGRQLVRRKFEHSTMYRVSQATAEGRDWVRASTPSLPLGLQLVAETFVALQEDRHQADYDSSDAFTRARALEAVERCELALRAWQTVRRTEESRFYLLALLLGPPRRP
jgi:hypothetical protein